MTKTVEIPIPLLMAIVFGLNHRGQFKRTCYCVECYNNTEP